MKHGDIGFLGDDDGETDKKNFWIPKHANQKFWNWKRKIRKKT